MREELIAELSRAVEVVERKPKARVTLCVFSDGGSRARIRVVGLDGISLTELLDERDRIEPQ